MCCFLPVDVDIFVGEYRATYRAYADGVLLHAHFFDNFSHKFVNYAVRTTCAVVHVGIVEKLRLFINQVLR